ncbi:MULTISPECIES: XrtA system polysaccharide chain length determinant [Halorhodospira]|uniref:XrtA system polysaccharide chain length determinant n=1 Tax=Halorhodospira TaxID=85108 RepID=UPI001EE96FC2|nr:MULTISPECIES: XrtA system polysaccharide chain length determinant [Halorhodospira]MCG5528466.1 lipopolysaccharide biosynthesis protein [Halorhodospira halophila]MCG5544422.1 lipopolysaccharide biosynthesis protein [Halorhodospira sp. 9628]
MEQVVREILHQLRATWRRRWWILPIAWLVCVPGWAYIHTIPDTYQASSEVYVDTDSVLDPLLSGMAVRPDSEQRMSMMTSTLLSRDNLREIARAADLDVLLGHDDIDAVVEGLQGIDLHGRDENIYTISFSHRDPEVAYRVVRETGNLFMERGLGDPRGDLVSSREFIENQLGRYAEELRAKEAEIEQFRRRHSEVLVAGGDFYSRLEAERESLEEAEIELEQARSQYEHLVAQLEGDGDQPGLMQPRQYENPELDRRIADLESELDEMRRQYTDAHPDVRHTQRILDDLREEREEQVAELSEELLASPVDRVGLGDPNHPMQMDLAEAESRVASLETRVEERRARLDELEAMSDEVPQIQSDYSRLQRDYEALQSSYDQLRDRLEQAVLAGEVETGTDSVDFRVLEPPQQPGSPAAPNRPLLASAVLFLGLAAGTGFAFLLAQVRGTVASPTKLGELTSRPVVGQVRRVRTPAHRRRRRMEMVVFSSATSALFVAYGVVIGIVFT